MTSQVVWDPVHQEEDGSFFTGATHTGVGLTVCGSTLAELERDMRELGEYVLSAGEVVPRRVPSDQEALWAAAKAAFEELSARAGEPQGWDEMAEGA